MKKFKKKPIVLFTVAVIILYVIIYIVPKVTGAMVSSYTAGYGELKLSDETSAYIVRNEHVYTAGTGGKVNRYIGNGTLVRAGTTILKVTGDSARQPADEYEGILKSLGADAISTENYSVEKGGVISYYADGFENKLRPDNMEKLSFDDYSRITPESVVNLKRDSIAEGEPVFKVVDRTRWYMVCFVEAEHKDRYEEGQEINVEFEDDTVSASVRSIKKTGDKVRIILETDHYYDKFAQARVSEVSLVTYEKRGLIIENASIGSEKGVQGVYVRNKTNEYVFVPIQVKATDGKYSLIADTTFYDEKGELYSTVEIYDEILKEPK